MSTQYGEFVTAKSESKNKWWNVFKTQETLHNDNPAHATYSNRFELVLNYWLRKGQLTNSMEIDVQYIFAVIVKYCGANRLWIVFSNSGIFFWRLSSPNPIKPRLTIGRQGNTPTARYFRYHIDSVTNTIYGFSQYDKDDHAIVKANIVKNGAGVQDIQWETLGKLPQSPFDYKKIRVFNGERMLCAESTLTIPDAMGAHAQRNCQILDFNLKQNAFTKPIVYGKYTKRYILDAMEQINEESFLCGTDESVFLMFPNKQKEDRFKTLKHDEQWQMYHRETSYCSGYNPLNANNLYCGYETKLKHYNLVKHKWFDCGDSHFAHTNYSRADMIGYDIVTTKWINDDPNLLYVSSLNRKDPNSQFTLHQDDVTGIDSVVDGAIVHYVMKQPLNEELYDIRCNQWIKMDSSSIELGPLKWAKFIRKRSRRCPVYPTGAGCNDQNCVLILGRQLLYFD
eukprot:169986_1